MKMHGISQLAAVVPRVTGTAWIYIFFMTLPKSSASYSLFYG